MATKAAANRRAARWARKRQGSDPLTVTLRPGRVYILPTGVGLVFALVTFAMLLGSMNYNNNLSFVLTFILAGLGFVAMHQCQRNLAGLEVSFAGVEPVFAGQPAQFRVAVTNHSRNPRFGLRLYTDSAISQVHDLMPGDSKVFLLAVRTSRRGRMRLERFGIRTLFPFELFRSWAWLHMGLDTLVYPRAADHVPAPPPTQSATGHRQHDARGEEDFAGLRKFHTGDSPHHVAWKAYARSGQLLSKSRLSILTRWVIDADRRQEDYGLRLLGTVFGPAHGDGHRRRCLGALALFGLEDRRG